MRKPFSILFLFAGCASAFGYTYSQLLTGDDVEYEHMDNVQGIALGSALDSDHPWESYNRWQCFSRDQVEFVCAKYEPGTLVPGIEVTTKNEILFFDTYLEDRLDCDQTLSAWRELVERGEEVCIFAANMPDVDFGSVSDGKKSKSLWYIKRVKGMGGYWN